MCTVDLENFVVKLFFVGLRKQQKKKKQNIFYNQPEHIVLIVSQRSLLVVLRETAHLRFKTHAVQFVNSCVVATNGASS